MQASNLCFCERVVQDGELGRLHVASDADLVQAFLHQRGRLNAGFGLVSQQRELERHAAAVDLLVANAVAVAVDPAGFVEQVFGLIEDPACKAWGPFLGKYQAVGMERALARLVQTVVDRVQQFVVVEGIGHRLADALVGEEGRFHVPDEVELGPLGRRHLRVGL